MAVPVARNPAEAEAHNPVVLPEHSPEEEPDKPEQLAAEDTVTVPLAASYSSCTAYSICRCTLSIPGRTRM